MHVRALRWSFAAFACVLAACSPRADPVVANRVLAPGDELAVGTLSPDEARVVLAEMAAAAKVDDPRIPSPARDGVRFSDAEAAAIWAADACSMAVVRSHSESDGVRFELITARDEPAELVVRRAARPVVYTATATVGTFGERSDEAQRLLEEFDRLLRAFGRKPGWEEGE